MSRSLKMLLVTGLFILPAYAQNSYVKIPGVPGTSQLERRKDWNEVSSFGLTLLPPAPQKDNAKILENRCALDLQTAFGKGGGAAVNLIDDLLADAVVVEVDKGFEGDAVRIYRAILSGAKIVAYDGSGNGSLSESIRIHFVQAEVTTWEQNPDGTIGPSTSGVFNCGPTP